MVFNGGGGAENVDLSANGNRLRFFRNPGNITMDTDGVEFVDLQRARRRRRRHGQRPDRHRRHSVNLDLAGTLGGTTGDGQTDHVIVNGTNGDDAVTVAGAAGNVNVSDLTPAVNLLHAEAADQLDVETFTGTDTVSAGGLAAGTIQLLVDGVLVP